MAERPFPIEFFSLEPDERPRAHLVLPEDVTAQAEPDALSPHFDASPERLLDAFVAAALSEPRTRELRREGLQVELEQKTAILKFRDYIITEAVARGEGAQLAVYSRSAVGYWDLNVNRKRVEHWLEKTKARL